MTVDRTFGNNETSTWSGLYRVVDVGSDYVVLEITVARASSMCNITLVDGILYHCTLDGPFQRADEYFREHPQ